MRRQPYRASALDSTPGSGSGALASARNLALASWRVRASLHPAGARRCAPRPWPAAPSHRPATPTSWQGVLFVHTFGKHLFQRFVAEYPQVFAVPTAFEQVLGAAVGEIFRAADPGELLRGGRVQVELALPGERIGKATLRSNRSQLKVGMILPRIEPIVHLRADGACRAKSRAESLALKSCGCGLITTCLGHPPQCSFRGATWRGSRARRPRAGHSGRSCTYSSRRRGPPCCRRRTAHLGLGRRYRNPYSRSGSRHCRSCCRHRRSRRPRRYRCRSGRGRRRGRVRQEGWRRWVNSWVELISAQPESPPRWRRLKHALSSETISSAGKRHEAAGSATQGTRGQQAGRMRCSLPREMRRANVRRHLATPSRVPQRGSRDQRPALRPQAVAPKAPKSRRSSVSGSRNWVTFFASVVQRAFATTGPYP